MYAKVTSHGSNLAGGTVGQMAVTFESRRGQSYHGTGGDAISIHDGKRFICVGRYYADGEFRKRLKPEHILRRPPAIAIQREAVEQLERLGCVRIVAEISDGRTLTVPFSLFLRESFGFDRGYGPQCALPLSRWQRADSIQPSLFSEVA